MNDHLAILFAVVLVGPSFAGCTDGGQETPEERLDRLLAAAPSCDTDPNSRTSGTTASNTPDGILTAVGYATSPDRTLLRWIPQQGHLNATYTVERTGGGSTQTTTVAPVTDPGKAQNILDTTDARWPNLSQTLIDAVNGTRTLSGQNRTVTSTADLVSFLHNHPRFAQMFAQRYYPVAIVLGTAYLDTQGQDGTTYSYTIQVKGGSTVGSVQDVESGQYTPLDPPSNPECVSLERGSPLRAGGGATWDELQQQQQLFHLNVYLRWDGAGSDGSHAWVKGYDVYRAKVPEDPGPGLQSLTDLTFERVNEKPIDPNPSNVTPSSGTTNTSSEAMDFYHFDRTPTNGTWVYRIGPRDLLGNSRDPSTHGSQLTDPLVASSFDFEPPEPPNNASAVPAANNSVIRVNWSHPNLTFNPVGGQVSTQSSHVGAPGDVGIGDVEIDPDLPREVPRLPKGEWTIDEGSDLSHFAVYRARNASARPPSPSCTDETRCWVHVGNTTTGVFVDNGTQRNVAYWYQIEAVDDSDAGNPSAPAGPTQASLVDATPPPAPRLENNDTYRDPGLGNPEDPASQRRVANGTYGPTLTVHPPPDDDSTRTRLYCRFDQGQNWTRVGTGPMDDAGVAHFHTADLYDPPTAVEAQCRARSVDEQGNVGDASASQTVTFGGRTGSQSLPRPIAFSARHNDSQPADIALSKIGTPIPSKSASSWRSPPTSARVEGTRINWSIPDVANLDHFEVVRIDPSNDETWTFRVDRDHRSVVDAKEVDPGKVVEYRIRAIPKDPSSGPSESDTVQTKVATSPDFADVRRPQREIGDLPLNVTRIPFLDHAVGLDWPTQRDDGRNRFFAVFRSVQQDDAYRQITPVQAFPPQGIVPPDAPTHAWNFSDRDVHRNYWYTVVEFDRRTGEPIRSSAPVQASNMRPAITESRWGAIAFQSGNSVPTRGPCAGSGTPPQVGDVITFAHGFDVRVSDTSPTGQGTADGEGRSTIDTAKGTKTIDLELDGVATDSSGNVCQGRAQRDFGGAHYPADGFTARLHQFHAGPKGTNALVDAEVKLPEKVTYWNGTAGLRWVPFADVAIHQDGTISFSVTVQQSCSRPSAGFQLEAAPTLVVPTGTVSLSKKEISLGSACTDYRPGDESLGDTSNHLTSMSRWLRTRGSTPSPLILGGANDGYLVPSLQASAPVTLDDTGLAGDFEASLDEPASWTTSAPAGFRVTVTGSVAVSFKGSTLDGGTLTQGGVSFSHYKNATGHGTAGPYRTSFQSLDLDPGGRAYGQISIPRPVRWRMLSTDPGQWELLLGNVTYGADPGRGLISPHPSRVESNVQALGKAHLEPGLNIRTSQTKVNWLCSGGSSFQTAMDAYVRRGGVSHAFRALLTGSRSQSFHGYDGGLRKWGRGFLDNHAVVDETVGHVSIPKPSNVVFQLDPARLDDVGCVKGGSGFGDRVLDYWNVSTSVEGIEFRQPSGGVPHDGDALLFAQGAHEVPHYDPSSSGPGSVPVEWAFLPGGDVNRTEAHIDEPRHEVDGFPFLLEDLRLSNVNEPVAWSRQANIEPAPDQDPTEEGFVELQGRMITPYFGQLTSDSGEPPNLRIVNGTDYLGFDRRPVVEKTWVDLDKAELVWAYDVVYAHNATQETGRFTAFESYQFLPLGPLFNALEKPKEVVNAGFADVNDTVQQAIEDARKKANKPFTQADQSMRDARSKALGTIDGANRTVSNHVLRYFQRVRSTINSTNDPALLEDEVTGPAFAAFNNALGTVRGSLDDLEDFRKNELQTAIDALLAAERALEGLQGASVDTHRMLRTLVTQLERAHELLGPKIDQLPLDLAGTKVDVGKLQAELQVALSDAKGLESTFSEVLTRVQPALAALTQGVRDIRQGLETVDRVLGDAVELADRALREVEGARDTIAGMIPSPQGGTSISSTLAQTLLQETYALQSAVLAPVHRIHERLRGLFTQAYDTLWSHYNSTVGTVKTEMNQLFNRVSIQLASQLDQLRTTVNGQIDKVVQPIRNVLEKARLVYVDASPVIHPEELGTYMGLASGVAAIRATAETRGRDWDQLSAAEQTRWRNRIGWNSVSKPYGKVYRRVAPEFAQDKKHPGLDDHTDSVGAVDEWLKGDTTPPKGTGMGTGGLLAQWGVNISEGRGSIQAEKVGQDDVQVTELKLRVRAQIGESDDDPTFKAELVGMDINRHGKYHVFGRDIETSIVKKDLSADVDLLINTSEPRFEGGLTVYKLEVEQVYIAESGVAVGVGKEILYVGIKFDGILTVGGQKYGVGGVVLAGKVDPDSPVLDHHFPETMERVNEVPAQGSTPYAGMYLSAHLDVPLSTITGVQLGCLLSLNVGGRLGLWYFQTTGATPPPFTFGIKVGGYAYGTVVCAIDARGEITVTFSFAGTIESGVKPKGTVTVTGTTWVATGVGKCESETWKGWENHFWDDSWCAQAGVYAQVEGSGELPGPKNMDVTPNVEADMEGPF